MQDQAPCTAMCLGRERERERASDRAVLGLEEDGDDVVSGRRVLAQPQDVLQGRDVHGRDDVWPMATAESDRTSGIVSGKERNGIVSRSGRAARCLLTPAGDDVVQTHPQSV